jgi:hypothetical protein
MKKKDPSQKHSKQKKVTFWVSPGPHVNAALAEYFAQHSSVAERKGVICSDGEPRNMWEVDPEVIRSLSEMRQTVPLTYSVWEQKGDKPPTLVEMYIGGRRVTFKSKTLSSRISTAKSLLQVAGVTTGDQITAPTAHA